MITYLAVLCSTAKGQSLEKQLLEKVKGAVYWLPQPYIADKLEFDAAGQLMSDSQTASPAMNSLVQITGLSLKNDALRIDGWRVLAVLSPPTNGTFSMVVTDFSVRVTIHLAQPISTEADAQSVWGRILSGGDPNQRLSGLWRPSSDGKADPKAISRGGSDGVVGMFDSRPVYAKGFHGVKDPKAPKSRHGHYASPELRGQAVVQVIIDEHGRPALLMVLNAKDPVQSEAAVTWANFEFSPAIKNGEPVPVLTSGGLDLGAVQR
jgi:hypothetical protein